MALSENERKVLAAIEDDFVEMEARRKRRRRRRLLRIVSLLLDVTFAVVVAVSAIDELPAVAACVLTGVTGVLIGLVARAAWRKDQVSAPAGYRTAGVHLGHRSPRGGDGV